MSLNNNDSFESFKNKTSLIKHLKKNNNGNSISHINNNNNDSNSTLSSSCSTHSPDYNTSLTSISSTKKSDTFIKRVIKDYKRLDHGLTKFESKSNSLLKANVLRVTLLPFLRTNSSDIVVNCAFNKTILSTSITCLVKWWVSLLLSLKSKSNSISSADRAVYLECISRIITRKEWRLNEASYQKLLTETLDYSISRLNLKTVSLSTSAFVGKVFAYSFFYLPEVSTLLMFLLGVKQYTMELLTRQIFNTNNLKNSFTSIKDPLDVITNLFPQNVSHIIGYCGKSNVPRSEKKFLNAMMAPSRPVKGITDPKGLWVKRWCAFDSNIFCSFLRHYLHIVSDMLVENADDSTNLNSLPLNFIAAAPGFMIIIAHFYETINDSAMNRPMKSSNSSSRDKDFNISILMNEPPSLQPQQRNAGRMIDPATNIPVNITKVLKTLRDYLHNSYDENEMLIAPFVVHTFDQLLQCFASKISAYNSDLTSYILDIAYEFMINIVQRSKESNCSVLLILSIDWNFWIGAVQNMLQTCNITCELKLLSMLFNVWDLLPSFNYNHTSKKLPKWYTNEQESIKWNLTTWLISYPIFDKYFCHWQPLVRSYYQRLICWRLIVFKNSELSEQDESIRRVVENRLNAILECMNELIIEYECKNWKLPEMALSSPMANRKMIIQRILQTELFFSDNFQQNEMLIINSNNNSSLRKIHAYEIFDDAIYCSNNLIDPKKPSLNSPPELKSTLSIIGSALKFFRGNANEPVLEQEPPTPQPSSELLSAQPSRFSTLLLTPPTGVSKTFSSLSLSSRSSSPSLMSSSKTSPPSSSISDMSDSDSLDYRNETEDSIEEDYENVNPPLPPELDKRAPDIIRPVFKFELVFNETGIQRQMQIIKDCNSTTTHIEKPDLHNDIPKSIKVPKLETIMSERETSPYYLSTDSEESDSEEFQDSEEDFIHMRLTPTRLKKFEFANSNLDIIGKSINEWNLIVDELQDFLENYLSNGGDLRFIDKVVPYLTVEYVNRAINAF